MTLQNISQRGQPGYDPRLNLGNILLLMLGQFKSVWVPRREISIDEGTIPFKGRVSFKVYNPNEPDKHGIKTYKVCDSTNGCNMFDDYVGCDNKSPSKFGETFDLVMNMIDPFKNQGYHIYGQFLQFPNTFFKATRYLSYWYTTSS